MNETRPAQYTSTHWAGLIFRIYENLSWDAW